MGRRGPPPKPTEQKKLEGTYRPDRAATNEVVAPVAAPAKPKGLSSAAGKVWDELAPMLVERRTLSPEDWIALEQLCRDYAQWRRYQAEAEKKPIVKTPFGPKINPASGEARKLGDQVMKACQQFGLTPSSRSRVSAAPKDKNAPPDKNSAAGFLFGNGPRLAASNGKPVP